MAKQTTAGSVDTYLAKLPPETRKVLERLRAVIHATAPGVTERISYGIPTFEVQGQNLLALAGWKNHVSLYPITGAMVKAFPDDIKAHRTGPGTLQFPLEESIPMTLIRGIVRVRVKEVSSGSRRGRPAARKKPK
jgi:uncharacterized protein YdhG (YjbR/CyaY superfamily)